MPDARLAERLADAIATRFCHDQDALLPSERQLAGLLGASRAMVREALAILRAQGRIAGGQGRPSYVRSGAPDPQSLEGLEARAVLEGEIAAIAALRAGPSGHGQLREHLRRMYAATTTAEYWNAERELHACLLSVAQNSVLAAVTQPLLDAAYAQAPQGNLAERLRSHQRLVAAIGRAQPQLARDLVAEVLSPESLSPTSSG